MMSKDTFFQPLHETLHGEIKKILFFNPENAFTVMTAKVKEVAEPITIVGNAADFRPGEEIRMDGNWVNNPRFGKQFQFSHAIRIEPTTKKGVERYLSSGLIEGIGPKLAERIVEHFGLDTLRILNEEPQRILEVNGIGKQKGKKIVAAWQNQHGLQEVMVFLRGYDVSAQNAIKIYKKYGNQSISLLRENPYQLAIDIRGIGFKTADQIARSLGIPLDSPFRAEAATLFLLQQTKDNGHTYYPLSKVVADMQKEFQIDETRVLEAISVLKKKEYILLEDLSVMGLEEDHAVYIASLGACEMGCASTVREMLKQPTHYLSFDIPTELIAFQKKERMELAIQQKKAIEMAIQQPISIITGGPGTGKTTIIKAVCDLMSKDKKKLVLAAPTGRAAKRLSESTGHEGKTIHRLLEFSPQEYNFQRDRDNPLYADMIIIDEASMIDIYLFYSLLRAIPENAQLLLVGDSDQLPSVGPGNVLLDLIQSEAIATTKLKHIFRQEEKGMLVENAHRINLGQKPLHMDTSKDDLLDYYFIPQRSPSKALEVITEMLLHRIPERFHLNPHEDIQVISPMHKGEVGVQNLNNVLQSHLTSVGEHVDFAGQKFYLNDRVIQTKNNYDKDIYNGDIGKVIEVYKSKKSILVDFEGKEIIFLREELDELQLAFAISVHKSQGSEYPAVILPLFTQHFMMLQRNLLYTAMTRGKKLVVLVGTEKALEMAINNAQMRERFSRLKERILGWVPYQEPNTTFSFLEQ